VRLHKRAETAIFVARSKIFMVRAVICVAIIRSTCPRSRLIGHQLADVTEHHFTNKFSANVDDGWSRRRFEFYCLYLEVSSVYQYNFHDAHGEL